RMGEDAVAAVEPAVRPPREAVERLVLIMVAPAVEHHLRGAVGLAVAVLVGNEEQRGGRADPDAAEADLETTDEAQVVGEDRALVERSVAVRVLEDEDRVPARRLPGSAGAGVRVVLGDPGAAPVVD